MGLWGKRQSWRRPTRPPPLGHARPPDPTPRAALEVASIVGSAGHHSTHVVGPLHSRDADLWGDSSSFDCTIILICPTLVSDGLIGKGVRYAPISWANELVNFRRYWFGRAPLNRGHGARTSNNAPGRNQQAKTRQRPTRS